MPLATASIRIVVHGAGRLMLVGKSLFNRICLTYSFRCKSAQTGKLVCSGGVYCCCVLLARYKCTFNFFRSLRRVPL